MIYIYNQLTEYQKLHLKDYKFFCEMDYDIKKNEIGFQTTYNGRNDLGIDKRTIKKLTFDNIKYGLITDSISELKLLSLYAKNILNANQKTIFEADYPLIVKEINNTSKDKIDILIRLVVVPIKIFTSYFMINNINILERYYDINNE